MTSATTSSHGWPALLGMTAADINAAIDAQPGLPLRSRPHRARRPDETTARLIAEDHAPTCPGVEVDVEAHREYLDGPLFSHILGYTGPVSADQLKRSRQGYLPDDLIGKAGVEATYETAAPRDLRQRERRARRARAADVQVLRPSSSRRPATRCS